MKTCSIDNCLMKSYIKNMCSKHYQRNKKHGSPYWVPMKLRGCSFEGCNLPYRSKGYCKKHYERSRTGINMTTIHDTSLVERFNSRIKVNDKTNCHEWIGYLNEHGYGIISVNKKNKLAHRFSYELSVGIIPEGLCVLHKCDNPLCVNTHHLFIGTQKDNLHDMFSKKRDNNGKKLNIEQVIEIKNALKNNTSLKELARIYLVTYSNIWAIKQGLSWKEVS